MQFAVAQSNVALSNVGQVSRASIINSRQMFRLMSDTLYQNKIGSLIREICCNAYDSHIAAGWPERQFAVHVPDEFEPFFSVRDFGVGLDDEGVRGVFVNYGDSTKALDPNQIGAFGLGSKTPYAYTDAFTIVAIKDGVKRQYTAFFDDQGFPSVALMSENPTDESNGVEIIVPVTNERDFRTFRMEIREQLRFFNVKPELSNCDEGIDWIDITTGQSEWMNLDGITVGSYQSAIKGVWGVQGVVGYKVDINLVSQNVTAENAAFLALIRDSSIVHFDLGKLEVIASREGISYTPATFAGFNAKLDVARETMTKNVTEQVAKLEGPWNKAYALNTDPTLNRFAKVCNASFTSPYYYKTTAGYYLDLARIANIDGKAPQEAGEIEVDEDGEKLGEENLALNLSLSFRHYSSELVRRVLRWRENGVGKTVKADDKFLILFRDTADKPVVRIREYMARRHKGQNVYVVENRDGSLVTDAQKAEILARIGEGFTGYTNLADVDLPTPEARAAQAGYKPPTAYTYEAGDDTSSTRFWQREYSKLSEWEEGAYYVTVDRLNIRMSSDARIVLDMADAGLLDRPVAAIREKDVAKLDATKWLPLEDKAKEVIEGIVSNKTLANAYALSNYSGKGFNFMDSGLRGALKEALDAGNISPKSPLAKVFRVETTLDRLKTRASNRGFTSLAERAFKLRAATHSFDALIDEAVGGIAQEVKDAYPVLSMVSSEWVYCEVAKKSVRRMKPEMAAHLVQYINLFDKAKTGA